MDKFGFKKLMFFITSIEIIIAGTLYFSVNIVVIYIISVLLISACIGGHFAILSPTFNKIFGLEKGPEMYGLTGNFIGIASVSGPLMSNFVLKEKKDFLVVFLVGGGLCFVKFIVLIIFKENDKFKYKGRTVDNSENNEDKNENNEPLIGEGETERIKEGRFFHDMTPDTCRELFLDAGLDVLELFTSGDVRKDRGGETWVNIIGKSQSEC